MCNKPWRNHIDHIRSIRVHQVLNIEVNHRQRVVVWVHRTGLQKLLVCLPTDQVHNHVVHKLAVAHSEERLTLLVSTGH